MSSMLNQLKMMNEMLESKDFTKCWTFLKTLLPTITSGHTLLCHGYLMKGQWIDQPDFPDFDTFRSKCSHIIQECCFATNSKDMSSEFKESQLYWARNIGNCFPSPSYSTCRFCKCCIPTHSLYSDDRCRACSGALIQDQHKIHHAEFPKKSLVYPQSDCIKLLKKDHHIFSNKLSVEMEQPV